MRKCWKTKRTNLLQYIKNLKKHFSKIWSVISFYISIGIYGNILKISKIALLIDDACSPSNIINSPFIKN